MYMTTEHVRAHKLIHMLITSYPSSSQVYTNKLKQTPEVRPEHFLREIMIFKGTKLNVALAHFNCLCRG